MSSVKLSKKQRKSGSKRQGKGNRLNLAIAKTHQVSSRMVGMQLTSGNFVALILSSIQMVAGFLILAQPIIDSYKSDLEKNGERFLVSGIGVLMAILVERLGLGGWIGMRQASEEIDRLEEEKYNTLRRLRANRGEMNEAELAELSRKEQELEEHHTHLVERQQKHYKQARIGAFTGMVLSTILGDFFWHRMYEPLGNGLLVLVMSLACAYVISLTFIFSELFKKIIDTALKGIIKDMELMKVAVSNERQNMQLDIVVHAFEALRNDPKKREPAQVKIEQALVTDLQNFAEAVGDGVDLMKIDGRAMRRKALPSPETGKRVLYRDCEALFVRYMQEHPNATLGMIMETFDIGKSTASEWRALYENEKDLLIEGEVMESINVAGVEASDPVSPPN
jgi:hypothetical protein